MRCAARAALALVAAATVTQAARAQERPLRDVVPPETLPPALLSAPLSGEGPASGPSASPLKTMPETLADAIGTWDLSLDGSNRRCELSLSGDSGPDGRILRFPAGCRRALPVLGRAAGWLFADRSIRIVDANVRPLIAFAPRPDARSMQGQAEHGERYSLVPLQTLAMLPAPDPKDLLSEPEATALPGTAPDLPDAHVIPGSQPVLPADALSRPDGARRGQTRPDRGPDVGTPATAVQPMPGVYALDRFSDKDVCRIVLDPRPAGRETGKDASRDAAEVPAPARILPGCRDGGISVFDPVSWRFAAGHLTLKAKRGHAVNLVAAGDGTWRRDPDVGVTFVLRKVE